MLFEDLPIEAIGSFHIARPMRPESGFEQVFEIYRQRFHHRISTVATPMTFSSMSALPVVEVIDLLMMQQGVS